MKHKYDMLTGVYTVDIQGILYHQGALSNQSSCCLFPDPS